MAAVQTIFRLNADAILDKIDRDHQRAFIRLGGYIRTVARRSMRRTKNKNTPAFPAPHPPRARIGTIRDLVAFAYDASRKELVVGPEYSRLRGGAGRPPAKGKTTVPNLQEKGGTLTVGPQGMILTKSVGKGDRRRVIQETRFKPGQKISIPARPFMAPALEMAAQEEKLKKYWEAIA